MLEMYLYRAKKIIISKNTLNSLKEAEAYLNKCRELSNDSDSRIYVWYGKLELKRSKLSQNSIDKQIFLSRAKDSFLMSLKGQKYASAYYGLYKTNILQGNWLEASEALDNCISVNRKVPRNFSLAYKLLNACAGTNMYDNRVSSDYALLVKITYKPLLDNYYLAETMFDQGQYSNCLKHLLICRKLSQRKEITLDLEPLIQMITQLLNVKRLDMIDELKKSIFNSSNQGERIILLRRIIKLNPSNFNWYFMLMDSYIALGIYSTINTILEEMLQYNPNEEVQKRMNQYHNLVIEQINYGETIMRVLNAMQAGDNCASKGDIKEAYQYYNNGLKSTGHSLFLSRIGDLLYKNGYYKEAEKYYLDYLGEGFEKKLHVYSQLYKSYKYLGEEDKAFSTACRAFENLYLGTKGYTLESWLKKLESDYNQELNSEENTCAKVKMNVVGSGA